MTDADWELFSALTSISVGDGHMILFRKDAWLQGSRIMDRAPDLFAFAYRRNRTLSQSLENHCSIRDIRGDLSGEALRQLVDIFHVINSTQIDPGTTDHITWQVNNSRVYSAGSAYHAQFHYLVRQPHKKLFWNCRVPEKYKFFGWFLVHDRIPISDVLEEKGFRKRQLVPPFSIMPETPFHLCMCAASRARSGGSA